MAIVADLASGQGARDSALSQYGGDTPYLTLTDGATITPNASTGNSFSLTLGGNRTIANPTNARAGDWLFFRIKQDATGSRSVTWGSAYKWPGGITPSLSTAANAVDHVSGFVQDSSTIECNLVRGY